ncbi:MAG TPA: group III truncated hemoglobin [Bacteroidia bacterium]|nr:group III truncated hemoglobin [Bacteroidia bacterium]
MKDISSSQDIELLIRKFYSDLLAIPEMQKPFEGIHFEEHIPKIVHFWSFVLLDEEGYKTNVFEKHLHLPIELPMFDTWLATWLRSVDSLFAGEKAELAKQRAEVLAFTFKAKWAKIKPS